MVHQSDAVVEYGTFSVTMDGRRGVAPTKRMSSKYGVTCLRTYFCLQVINVDDFAFGLISFWLTHEVHIMLILLGVMQQQCQYVSVLS